MANHAYLRVWTRVFALETMLPEFARFLTTGAFGHSRTL